MVKRDVFINLINNIFGVEKLDKQSKAMDAVSSSGQRMTEAVEALSKPTTELSQKESKLANSRQFLADQSDRLGKNTAQVSAAMSDQGAIFSDTGEVVDKANRPFKDINSAMEDGIRNTQPFQMGFLGVMFAGMALDRAMTGLVKTSMEWVGITELMSLTMGILFLPIAELFLNALLPILSWFMELPDWAKTAIGSLVLFFLVVGKIAFLVGQFGLALASLNMFKFGQTILGMFGIGDAATKANGKVTTLKTGLGKLGGALLIGLAIGFAIKGLNEGSLMEALDEFLISGIAIGLAALAFGAGAIPAIAIGALTFVVLVGIKWIFGDDAAPPTIDEMLVREGQLTPSLIPTLPEELQGLDLTGGIETTGLPTSPSFRLPEGFSDFKKIDMTIIQNIQGSTTSEIKREIDKNNITLVQDIRRKIK